MSINHRRKQKHAEKNNKYFDLGRSKHDRNYPCCRAKYLSGISLFAIGVYILNRIIIANSTHPPAFLAGHLGDLLALPVYLPLSVIAGQKLDVIPTTFRFTWPSILIAGVLFSGIFEGLLPLLTAHAVRDGWDSLAYLTGGSLLILLEEHPLACAESDSVKEIFQASKNSSKE